MLTTKTLCGRKWHLWEGCCLTVIGICLALGVAHFFKNDIYYDTDIARDFLLWQDMIDTHKISLIGGRSSLAGLFHGPLYYWLGLPFFIVGHGNPVVVAVFWLLVYWLFLGGFYYCAREMFNHKVALVATSLIVTLTCFYPAGYTHTVLANFLIIPLIYFVGQYCQRQKIKDLIITILLCGVMIQFQLAFGVPMTVILGLMCLCQIVKRKNWRHLLCVFAILIPLSTYILFDLRHDLMQTKSVLASFGEMKPSLDSLFDNHRIAFFDSWRISLITNETWHFILTIASLVFVFESFKKLSARKTLRQQEWFSYPYLLLITIAGFWIIVLNYHGHIWGQYYRTLLPVIVLLLVYLMHNNLSRHWCVAILFFLIGGNLFKNINQGFNYLKSTDTSDEIHWKFYRQMMTEIQADAGTDEFGYYIFTPDQYGYQAKYAARYFWPQSGRAYQKMPKTYLLIAPDISNNPWANSAYWQKEQIKISRDADQEWTYSRDDAPSYTVKRFDLTATEATVSADPNLLDGIQFR